MQGEGIWDRLVGERGMGKCKKNLLPDRRICLVSFRSKWRQRIISLKQFLDMVVLKKGIPHSFDHKSSTSIFLPLCTPLAKSSAIKAFNSGSPTSQPSATDLCASATVPQDLQCYCVRVELGQLCPIGCFGTALSRCAVLAG